MELRNVLMAGNFSQPDTRLSDGIEVAAATAMLSVESSTLAENNVAVPGNVGLRYMAGTVALTNTIVWGHAEDLLDLPVDALGNLANVTHCLFGAPLAMDGVQGCLVGVDPRFAGMGDYRLQDGLSAFGGAISPAVDAGMLLPWMAEATDLAGQPRVRHSCRNLGRRVDMGAYETEGPAGTLFLLR